MPNHDSLSVLSIAFCTYTPNLIWFGKESSTGSVWPFEISIIYNTSTVTLTAYHLHYCLCDGEHCRVKYKVAAWVSLAKIAPSNGLQRDKKNSATTTSSAPAAALIVMKAAYEGVNPYRPAVKHPKVLLSIPINPNRPFHPIHPSSDWKHVKINHTN